MAIIEPEFITLTSDLDVDAFWSENDLCGAFTINKPRCSASFSPDDHWLFEFLGIPSTLRYYRDKLYRDGLHRETNAILRKYVGRPYFAEDTWEHSPRRIENLFGCEFAFHEGGTPWLVPVTDDPGEFARVLDRAEATDVKDWALTPEFVAEWELRRSQGRDLQVLGTGSRGPATIMTSVLAIETFFFWIYDEPALIARFRDILAHQMIAMNRALRDFCGNDNPGWWITDDNCALFSEEIYLEFCKPVLDGVLNAFAPGDARRFQHSDSAMGHLLDAQRELGMTEVNYGPTVDVGLIREKFPRAIIKGQLPPFLLRNGSPCEIKARIIDDFQKGGRNGGLEITTAGSLAAGTGVGRMRWFMKIVRDHCRYT